MYGKGHLLSGGDPRITQENTNKKYVPMHRTTSINIAPGEDKTLSTAALVGCHAFAIVSEYSDGSKIATLAHLSASDVDDEKSDNFNEYKKCLENHDLTSDAGAHHSALLFTPKGFVRDQAGIWQPLNRRQQTHVDRILNAARDVFGTALSEETITYELSREPESFALKFPSTDTPIRYSTRDADGSIGFVAAQESAAVPRQAESSGQSPVTQGSISGPQTMQDIPSEEEEQVAVQPPPTLAPEQSQAARLAALTAARPSKKAQERDEDRGSSKKPAPEGRRARAFSFVKGLFKPGQRDDGRGGRDGSRS